MTTYKRQGDVLFTKKEARKELPDIFLKKGHTGILVHGEVTGHSHKVSPETLGNVEIFVDRLGQVTIRVNKPAQIVHEDHGTVDLEEGDWEVGRQREYQPDGARNVAD